SRPCAPASNLLRSRCWKRADRRGTVADAHRRALGRATPCRRSGCLTPPGGAGLMRAVCAASVEGALPAVVGHGATLRTAPVDTRADYVRADSQLSKNKQDQRQGWAMSVVETDLQGVVEDTAAHLYVWALKDIPQDLRDALADAAGRETSVPGKRVLATILRNIQVADDQKNLVCQDTGIAVYTCRVGEQFPLHPARIQAALKAGTERATVEHPLRSNAVHTITRENTGPNTGYRLPIVHWEFIPEWDGLDVKC